MEEIDVEKCNFRQFSEIQKLSYLDLDLGSSHGHISMHNKYRTTSLHDDVTLASSSREIRPCEIRVISTLKSCYSFLGRKFENRAPKSCRLCPMLSQSAISFDFHCKMEIIRKKCNFRQFSEIQKLSDVDLDLGSGQGHTSMHNRYRTIPAYATM